MNEKRLRILMISLDKALLEDGAVRERVLAQNAEVDLTILVFSKQAYDQTPNEHVRIVATASWNRFAYVPDAMQRIWFWRKRLEFDVIVTQDPVETAFVGAFAARLFNAALAIQDHGYFFHGNYYRKESFLNYFRYWYARWAINRADAIRVVSQRTEKALIGLGIEQEKIVRFHLAQSSYVARPTSYVDEADAGRLGRATSDDIGYFFLAARFVPIKRIDLAIHAFSLVAKHHRGIKFVINGKGPLENAIKNKIKEFGMEDEILLAPWGSSLEEKYRGALATIISSDREGFGMTALESLSCGTSVIMTDVGCAGEVVMDGVNGYVVPVGDVDALADRMERIIADPAKLRDKGYAAARSEVGMMDLYRIALKRHETRYEREQ